MAAVAHPSRAVALIVLLLRLPRVHLTLSGSPAGQQLRQYFDQRFLGILPQNLLCQGVLVLPEHHSDYLGGRRRRTVRNNLRRAASAGIRCESGVSTSVALQAASNVFHDRRGTMTAEDVATLSDGWPTLFEQPAGTMMIARDRDDNPVGLAVVVIDTEVCLIRQAIASSHEARWALHDHLVQSLIERRVKYLLPICGGPFGAVGLPPNVQYHQHLLGYELYHIVPYRWLRLPHGA
jgi:hypothetical protein